MRRAKQRGRDLRYTLEVTFEEAIFGCTKTIAVPNDPGNPQSPTREFSVAIPAGTKEGGVRVMAGDGEPGKGGGPPGDLHVIVRVKAHGVFRRDGAGRFLEARRLHAEHHRVNEHGVTEAERAPVDDPRTKDHAIGIEDGGILSPLRDFVLT